MAGEEEVKKGVGSRLVSDIRTYIRNQAEHSPPSQCENAPPIKPGQTGLISLAEQRLRLPDFYCFGIAGQRGSGGLEGEEGVRIGNPGSFPLVSGGTGVRCRKGARRSLRHKDIIQIPTIPVGFRVVAEELEFDADLLSERLFRQTQDSFPPVRRAALTGEDEQLRA